MKIRCATLALALLACHSAPTEPTPPPAKEAPKAPSVHVIVEKDHRSVAKLAVGDYVELPHDAEFAWTIKFENGSYFDPAPASDAGVERYRATRTGIVRTLVSGAPKVCIHSDAACPLAEYAWSVTLQVD
jgi:hypothetical protein